MRYRRHVTRIGTAPFTAAMALALAGLGCGAEETVQLGSELVAAPTTEMLAQDSSYMARLFNERTNGLPFLTLDLGDERQYRFVINRLLRAGKNPSNSPRLFQHLREIRAAHPTSLAARAHAGGAVGSGEVTTANNAGGGGIRCGHFLIPHNSVAAGAYNSDSHAVMSCYAGADVEYVYLDQTMYRTDENETYYQYLGNNYEEAFTGIEVRTPSLHGSVPASAGHSMLIETFGFAMDDETGTYESTYTRHKNEADDPATIRKCSPGAALAGASCEFDHPIDATGDGIIRACYQRSFTAGVGDCDYVAVNAANQPGVPPYTHIAMMENVGGVWTPSTTERWPIPGAPVSSVPDLYMPMVGNFVAGSKASNNQQCRITNWRAPDVSASAFLRTTGGWCTGAGTQDPTDGGQLLASLSENLAWLKANTPSGQIYDVDFGKTEWDGSLKPLIDFGPDCLANLQDACMVVNISAFTNCNDGVPGAPDFTRTATCEVCFDVRNSCFAAGTMIRRANGTTVPVEEVQVGDEIIANGAGSSLTVTATTSGVEPEPMVRLKDSLGHELMLTSKHPVITTRGAMPADEVTTMSQVETEDGIASIVEVERVPYKGRVYNLSVGTPEQIAMVSGVNRTMFAGGIRVGDNEMQFDLERQSAREKAKRAPAPAWETDRKHALSRKQRATRR